MSDPNDKETLTIRHYDDHAEAFWAGTKDHDVSQNIEAFLTALPKGVLIVTLLDRYLYTLTCCC